MTTETLSVPDISCHCQTSPVDRSPGGPAPDPARECDPAGL